MSYCSFCKTYVSAEVDDANGFTCCTACGRVLEDNVFSTDPTFSKTPGGTSTVDGNFVPESGVAAGVGRSSRGRIFGYQVDSHEKTINKGKHEIGLVAERLGVRPREELVGAAHRLYKLAVQRNFTRGRRTQQVAGACLYIVCRQDSKPYMLIDFSDILQSNVYTLGSVFLQLCRLLRLEHHPLVQRPVDPSLFIHRFADRLEFGKQMHGVANTALRLVASMKRDWMQTGRRPSGVCGAALFIAAHIHGFERSKRDVVSVVHVCEATLRKRLTEFERTDASGLTVEEFDSRALEYEQTMEEDMAANAAAGSLTCEHKDSVGVQHHALGMCRKCYEQFFQVSGGIAGGYDPPAFTRSNVGKAKTKRSASTTSSAQGKHIDETSIGGKGTRSEGTGTNELEGDVNAALLSKDFSQAYLNVVNHPSRTPATTPGALAELTRDSSVPTTRRHQHPQTTTTKLHVARVSGDSKAKDPQAEPETLSDLDEDEIQSYLHGEEEVKLKQLVWEELNKDYIKDLESKKVAPTLETTQREGEDADAAGKGKWRGAKRKSVGAQQPAETAEQATRQMLASKKLSSKINYAALEGLFDNSLALPTHRSSAKADNVLEKESSRQAGSASLETQGQQDTQQVVGILQHQHQTSTDKQARRSARPRVGLLPMQ